MTVAFQTLDRRLLAAELPRLIAVSADVSPWSRENFERDLPGKWELSFVARDPELAGYVILTRRGPDWVHVNQFMVAPAARGRGIGRAMLDEAKRRAAGGRLTLKVDVGNSQAIGFYAAEGLTPGATERGYLWMHWPPGGGPS